MPGLRNVARHFFVLSPSILCRIVSVLSGKPGKSERNRIESEPIKISVYEAVGDELTVWNLMNSNPDIGFFVQMNEPPLGPSLTYEARTKLLTDQIEAAIAENGDGILVNQLKQKLEKWRDRTRLIKTNNSKYPNDRP